MPCHDVQQAKRALVKVLVTIALLYSGRPGRVDRASLELTRRTAWTGLGLGPPGLTRPTTSVARPDRFDSSRPTGVDQLALLDSPELVRLHGLHATCPAHDWADFCDALFRPPSEPSEARPARQLTSVMRSFKTIVQSMMHRHATNTK